MENSTNFEDYLVIDDFFVHDECIKYKDDMISFYKENLFKQVGEGHSVLYTNKKFLDYISQPFLDVIYKNFDVGKSTFCLEPFVYVQDNNSNLVLYHNHLQTATVNSVFYLDPPEDGGELSFHYSDYSISVKPEINKIYMFPSWLDHSPLPHEDSKIRVSINIEYMCRERAINLNNGMWW